LEYGKRRRGKRKKTDEKKPSKKETNRLNQRTKKKGVWEAQKNAPNTRTTEGLTIRQKTQRPKS